MKHLAEVWCSPGGSVVFVGGSVVFVGGSVVFENPQTLINTGKSDILAASLN